MSFFNFRKEKMSRHIENCPEVLSGVQQWPYYRDLTIQSSQCTISSELGSLRHSRLHRSLYSLVYTPNDELHYFVLYMESCSQSSYLKFLLEISAFDRIMREKSRERSSTADQQTSALALFHRYLSIDAQYPVPIDDDIRRTTLLLICPLENSSRPEPDCFRMAREHIWQLIERSVYPAYLDSRFHLNYQLQILTSNRIQLYDILCESSALSYLIKFAKQEQCIDLLQFWIAVERFHENILNRNLDNRTLTDNALSIYDQYISLQAPLRLGFDDDVRGKIECSICQPDIDAGPSIDTFDQAAWIVYNILQREYFPSFLKSFLFYRYINDLMLNLRDEDSSPHSHTEIDAASDTPVQIGAPTSLNRQRNLSASSSSCLSVNQETEVRPKGRLSMGYVDSLGRFIRDPDVDSIGSHSPSSHHRRYSRPLQFLTQLIRNEHDEITSEEEAAAAAQSLINEITNHSSNLEK